MSDFNLSVWEIIACFWKQILALLVFCSLVFFVVILIVAEVQEGILYIADNGLKSIFEQIWYGNETFRKE